jgi:hypothetical protein
MSHEWPALLRSRLKTWYRGRPGIVRPAGSKGRALFVAVLAGFIGLLASAASIEAQEEPKPSPEPAVFKSHLLQFTQLTRKNLQDIQALPVDDSVPVDPVVRSSARRAYILIRAAWWGMDLAMQKATYRDPMLVLAQKRVDEARDLARYPVDYAVQNVPRAEYISKSVQDLSRSLKLVQQALVILP